MGYLPAILSNLLSKKDASATYATLFGEAERNYKMVACVLRNNGSASGYWQPISDATHEPHNVDSVSTSSTGITINYGNSIPTAKMMASFVVGADETLGQWGFIAGASVALDHAEIQMTRAGRLADYISYNGSAFISASGRFTISNWASGVLTLTHSALTGVNTDDYDISITGRGGAYQPQAGGVADGDIQVSWYDWTGALVTAPTTDCKAFVSVGNTVGVPLDPTQIDNTKYPGGNLWVLGFFEVA